MNSIILAEDEVCAICRDNVIDSLNIMKPCNVCNIVMHSICWAINMKHQFDIKFRDAYADFDLYTCPGCRNPGHLCENEIRQNQTKITTCDLVNILCSVQHYSDSDMITQKKQYAKVKCHKCTSATRAAELGTILPAAAEWGAEAPTAMGWGAEVLAPAAAEWGAEPLP